MFLGQFVFSYYRTRFKHKNCPISLLNMLGFDRILFMFAKISLQFVLYGRFFISNKKWSLRTKTHQTDVVSSTQQSASHQQLILTFSNHDHFPKTHLKSTTAFPFQLQFTSTNSFFYRGKTSMSRSHPSIHPVDLAAAPSTAAPGEENIYPPMRLRMKDIQGMPGTCMSLVLRAFQFLFAAISLAVMASTSDFPSVTAFRYRLDQLIFQLIFVLVAVN